MASTYAELYSDFQSEVALYHEHAAVTDRGFMRVFTKVAQEFQKITKVVESEKQLFRDNNFYLGNDVLEIIEIADENNNNFFIMEYKQYTNELEYLGGTNNSALQINSLTQPGNRAETVDKFDLSRHPPETNDSQYGRHTRIATVTYNSVIFTPDRGDAILELRYIPDLHAFSKNSPQWTAWFDNDGADFLQLFTERGLGDEISPFEDAILQKAVSKYLFAYLDKDKSKAMQAQYDRAIETTLANKRQLYSFGMAQYSISPY